MVKIEENGKKRKEKKKKKDKFVVLLMVGLFGLVGCWGWMRL